MALEASSRAGEPMHANLSRSGEVLASNMAAGFALELALKLFYMTFNEKAPPETHNLERLWTGLHPDWQADISRNYAADPRSQSEVLLMAFQRAPQPPERPEAYKYGGFASAQGLFAAIADTFVGSRYFYEKVNVGAWAHIDHPIAQMSAMLDVLTAFYDHRLKMGDTEKSAPS